ncbi:MAG: O-antigen ligase family protein [Rhizobiaceae bacterium]|nr:O-antigen ligase family protein [Rhizobiaceae bacterium]
MNSNDLAAPGGAPPGSDPLVGHEHQLRNNFMDPLALAASGRSAIARRPPNRATWVIWSRGVCGIVGIFLFLSALWFERDSYRVGIIILGIVGFFGVVLREYRPRPGWVELACVLWTAFVAIWYCIDLFATNYGQNGSSEGIYLFPALFPLLGYALFLMRNRAELAIWLFFSLSFLWLMISTNESAILSGQRVDVLFHKNTIHGSVAVGIMLICSLAWIEELATDKSRPQLHRLFGGALAFAVMALCFLNIFGGKSKGIWLSLLLIMPLQLLAMAWRTRSRTAYAISAVAAILAIGFAVFFSDKYWAVAGPVAVASEDVLKRFAGSGFSLDAVNELIAQGNLPDTLSIRLQLWINALEIWQHSPWFGNGVMWESLLPQTRYADQPFNVFHNGYLEIAVRYGLFGLAFMAVLYAIFVGWVRKAANMGLISDSAFICFAFCLAFFMLTLLTNSNNRLAIGESFVLFSAAFAFCCRYWIQLAENPAEAARLGLR